MVSRAEHAGVDAHLPRVIGDSDVGAEHGADARCQGFCHDRTPGPFTDSLSDHGLDQPRPTARKRALDRRGQRSSAVDPLTRHA